MRPWGGRLCGWAAPPPSPGRSPRPRCTTSRPGVLAAASRGGAAQRQRPYGLLGGRVEYGRADRRWAVAAYARNLTNTDYITATFGTVPTAFGGRPGSSRQFSVELTVRR